MGYNIGERGREAKRGGGKNNSVSISFLLFHLTVGNGGEGGGGNDGEGGGGNGGGVEG